MTAPLHLVPSDQLTPYPISWARVEAALEQIGCHFERSSGDSLRVESDGVPFTVTMDPEMRYLSMRTTWDPHLDYESAEETLFAVADSWNRERYFPTIYVLKNASNHAEVVIDHVIDCQDGVTDGQLRDGLRVGFQTGPDAVFYMQDAAISVLGLHVDHPILPE